MEKIYEEYSSKLDTLLNEYIKLYNEAYNKMLEGTEDLFKNEELDDYKNWWNYMKLSEVEYPELHICKSSLGWKPIF